MNGMICLVLLGMYVYYEDPVFIVAAGLFAIAGEIRGIVG